MVDQCREEGEWWTGVRSEGEGWTSVGRRVNGGLV